MYHSLFIKLYYISFYLKKKQFISKTKKKNIYIYKYKMNILTHKPLLISGKGINKKKKKQINY